jgi:hypothetical protein
MLAFSNDAKEISVVNDRYHSRKPPRALCIKPDKLRVEVGLAQRSPVEHAVGRKIMDKCRPRKFFDEIRRNRARADKPIGFWILTGKTSCNSFVEIDVANNSPVS